jgi:hypothetical protein
MVSMFLAGPLWAQTGNAGNNRVEDLFLWKISEELKLSVKEEKDLSNVIKELNQKKSKAGDQIQELISKMSSSKNAKESKKLLFDYETALKNYNGISLEEVKRLEKTLSPEKVTKYFVVKAELTAKIRNLMANPEKNHQDRGSEKSKGERVSLPEPRVIEE